MISYTKRYVNILSFIITILVYSILINSNLYLKNIDFNSSLIFKKLKKNSVLVELKTSNINQETEEKVLEKFNNYPQNITKESTEIKNSNKEEKKITSNNSVSKSIKWKIIIPKISLEAEISEGTSKQTMDRYVGHFEETTKNYGNIGLAAHNRGYAVNYFSEIKKLKQGDEIKYRYHEFEKTYIVTKNIIIKDTDWSYLEKTEENKITLITCVENEPEYRRCVQAIEKK